MNYNNIYYMKKNIFILLAAGIGKRFDKKIAKQFIKIGNFNPIELIINEIIVNKLINFTYNLEAGAFFLRLIKSNVICLIISAINTIKRTVSNSNNFKILDLSLIISESGINKI